MPEMSRRRPSSSADGAGDAKDDIIERSPDGRYVRVPPPHARAFSPHLTTRTRLDCLPRPTLAPQACRKRAQPLKPKLLPAQFNTQLGHGAFKEVFKGYDEEEGNEIAWCQVVMLGHHRALPCQTDHYLR